MATKISKVAWVKIKLLLSELVSSLHNVEAGVIATADGMAVVGSNNDKEQQEKLAAMSSSLFALGQAVVREVASGSCTSVTVEGDNTKIFVLGLTRSPALALMLVSNQKALIGEVIYAAKRCGSQIRETLASTTK